MGDHLCASPSSAVDTFGHPQPIEFCRLFGPASTSWLRNSFRRYGIRLREPAHEKPATGLRGGFKEPTPNRAYVSFQVECATAQGSSKVPIPLRSFTNRKWPLLSLCSTRYGLFGRQYEPAGTRSKMIVWPCLGRGVADLSGGAPAS
jgi:hypothetical protein